MTEPRPFWLAGVAQRGDRVLDVPDRSRLGDDGSNTATVALARPEDTERALTAAHAARRACAHFPRHARRRALIGVARAIEARGEELALQITRESGKPITDARGEVVRAVTTFELAAETCDERAGEYLDLGARPSADRYTAWTRRVPVGVLSLITPFNFPLNLVAHKVAPAIASGCPFIVKPSEKTPLSALSLAEILAEQELPEGSWSVLPLEIADSATLIEDPRVALVSFTGSETVGWDISRRAAGKRVALELGGNAACIVHCGADVEDVVERVLVGGYGNSGQSCISVQRILVHESLADALRERLVARVRDLPTGDPLDPATRVGPLIDEAAAARVTASIEAARDAGAAVLCGGERDGRLVRPAVVDGVPGGCTLDSEELFGPAVGLRTYRTLDEAVALADDGRFGLQLGAFGLDLDESLALADAVEVGGLILGDVPTFRADAMPYGGRRRSGLGREGPRAALLEFTEEQVIVTRRRR